MFKNTLICLIFSFLLCFTISLLYYGELTLLTFVNSTFFIGGALIFFSLTVFVLSTGFFDVVSNSFRRTFSMSRVMNKEEAEEMRSLSEAISIVNIKPFLYAGIIIYFAMAVGLVIFYR
ncbi:DUF3899 domain-containing protein [Jeotgalibacillus sp. S-D1]|uniref:DUF3899 domain-containing protein n=1 Tax=Jeotgalibacillus sp. S-D1 TaxID=2552189 RepID=UPI001404B0EC|nr:DUF3899 domain-containing protein [Jeotgalibacillus sp. S-D1]